MLELPTPIPVGTANGAAVDLGAQLTDQIGAGGAACRFYAPADVYVDGYGGIDQVRWSFVPWTPKLAAVETGSGCVSGSCLRIDGIAQWSGFHLMYVQSFPRADFGSLHIAARTVSGSGTITVAPSYQGAVCNETTLPLTSSFTEITIDLAIVCPGTPDIDGVTVQATDALSLVLDDVRLLP